MNPMLFMDMKEVFFCGYVLLFSVINLIALFISVFYSKKLGRRAPKKSFIAVLISGVLLTVLIPFDSSGLEVFSVLIPVLLLFCSAVSIYASISLYYTMTIIRK